MRADASIGPYKWGLGLQQEIYVPTRRGEGTHLQPKSRTCVRLASETRLRAQRPTAILWGGNT